MGTRVSDLESRFLLEKANDYLNRWELQPQDWGKSEDVLLTPEFVLISDREAEKGRVTRKSLFSNGLYCGVVCG